MIRRRETKMASDGSPIEITFFGKKGVSATSGPYTVNTDQPVQYGGEGKFPAPFDYLLYALGTCAGFFVRAFLKSRGLPEEGVYLTETVEWGADDTLSAVRLKIHLPAEFPEKYHKPLVRAADTCSVKKMVAGNLEVTVEIASN